MALASHFKHLKSLQVKVQASDATHVSTHNVNHVGTLRCARHSELPFKSLDPVEDTH